MIEQILCFLVLIICLVYGLALLSWLVMKLDIEKRRSKRTKFFEMIGGNLMEIENLIERLQNWDGIKPDREIDCAIEGLKALQAENDRLKEEAQQMRWIPVEEMLPEEGKRCLLYTPCDGIICVGYYAGKDEWQHRHKWRLVTAMRSTQTLTKKVTHWMPLPKAPKEEKE